MQTGEIIAIAALLTTLLTIFFNIYSRIDSRLDIIQSQVQSLYQGLELMEGKINLSSCSQSEFMMRIERRINEAGL